MPKKISGALNLTKLWGIDKSLVKKTNKGEDIVYIDIVPNRNGPDNFGNTHSIQIYDRASRKPIYLGNLKEQDFGNGGQQGGQQGGQGGYPF